MALITVSVLVQILVTPSLFYALYYVYWQLTTGASHRALIRQHDCKPVKKITALNSFPDNFFGTKVIRLNLKALKEHRLLSAVRDRYLTNGNTFKTRIMFTDVHHTIEPRNLKTIMATNFKDWKLGERRFYALGPLLGHGIFTNDGAAWQHSRELIRPNFTRSQIGDLATFESHVKHLIQALPHDGSTVDLQYLFFQLTMDSATEFLFGESTNCLAPGYKSEQGVHFAKAFDRSQRVCAERGRSGKASEWLQDMKQYSRDIKTCHDFADFFVRKALEYRESLDLSKGPPEIEEGKRYIFLYELVKRVEDPVAIRSELLNVLLAGRDTTASLLSDVWFTLARRPDVWSRLREEVDALEGKHPTIQQIRDMRYLRIVLNETLRLYPVVPGNGRVAACDTVLPLGGGPDGKSPLFIPKGGIAFWSAYALHRRSDYYGYDAEDFKPERWNSLKPGWEYLPFNGGPRVCLGQQFALTEASYTTIRLMQEFSRIEARDDRPWTESLTLTCAIDQGTLVGLIPAH